MQNWVASSPIRQQWYEIACKLEGLPRNESVHAAGVVLTPTPLVDHVPLSRQNDGIYITQWTMEEVEAGGTLKIDLLSLRNLGIIEEVQVSLERVFRIKPTLETIPLDDANTFRVLQRGLTEGIFQFESDGAKTALKQIMPTNMNDVIAINALNRPGPMEFIPSYARRKYGHEEIVMPHPSLEAILKETYGIIVFQEQILKIAQVFAGFTVGEADLLRRAISKKKREILLEQQKLFVAGAIKQGRDEKIATEIYELIVKFSDYGFPKSHATVYSIISYQMAFLKANYPSHFYSALLNNAAGNTDKINRILAEAKLLGVEVVAPNFISSEFKCRSLNKKIQLGFNMIKGINENKVNILKENMPTADMDFFDFAEKVGSSFDGDVVEKLIKVGAFDNVFPVSRDTLLASLPAAIQHSTIGETLNFAFSKPEYETSSNVTNPSTYEKEVLGIYISGHPVTEIRQSLNTQTAYIQDIKNNTNTSIIGLVESIRETKTKKNELMAFVNISDEHSTCSVTLFPQVYSKVKELLTVNSVVNVIGNVEDRNGKLQIKATMLKTI